MKTESLVQGLFFGEGARWHEGRLWFSDFYDHKVKSVDESGQLQIELELDLKLDVEWAELSLWPSP